MTHEQIFESYINDECPICGEYLNSNNPHLETITGGKVCSQYFICKHCASEYVVGYNRRTNPILSEIIVENKPIYKHFTVSAEFEVNVLEQLGGKIPNGDREDFNNWLKYKALELGTGSHFEYYIDDLGIHEYGVAFEVKLKKVNK